MRLVDPTVQSSAPPRTQAARLAQLDGLKIGLLWNTKVNGDVLLTETAKLFHERHNCTVLDSRTKRNAGAPAPAETLAQIANEADFLITSMGD